MVGEIGEVSVEMVEFEADRRPFGFEAEEVGDTGEE